MKQEDINRFLYSLYDDVSPMSVSIACRKKLGVYDDKSFVYGDSHLPSLADIFKEVKPQSGEIFYDLGSGGGRLVLFAALSFPFAKCIGIEFLEDLYNMSLTKLEQCKKNLANLTDFDPTKLGEISFTQADFLTVDIRDANIVYIASTCLTEDIFKKLTTMLEEQLAPGTRVITFTRGLISNKFKLLKNQLYPMEWGQVTVFFHEKL